MNHHNNNITNTIYIGLGSNLQNPLGQITGAFTALNNIPKTRLLAQSQLYRSTAVGPGKQPDYVNAVAQLETGLTPYQLLKNLQGIESSHGRNRGSVRWTPRTLDLDLLLFGNMLINTDTLTVPHPRIQDRNFVLFPLHDLAPKLRFPDGTTLVSLIAQCPVAAITTLDESGKIKEPTPFTTAHI